MHRALLIVLVAALATTLGGCLAAAPSDSIETLEPARLGPSLAGTWKATESDGDTVAAIQLTIDEANRLTAVYMEPPPMSLPIGSGTVVEVSGRNVTFTAHFPMGTGGVSFEGALNEAGTAFAGTMRVRVSVGAPGEATTPALFIRQ